VAKKGKPGKRVRPKAGRTKKPGKPRPRKLSAAQLAKREKRFDAIDREYRRGHREARTRLQSKLANALDTAQLMAIEQGYLSGLQITTPLRKKSMVDDGRSLEFVDLGGPWISPWVLVGEFAWSGDVTYDDLYAILTRWMGKRLENRIDKNRWAKLAVTYIRGDDKRTRGEYHLGASGPWSTALSQAREKCNPTSAGSLAQRYGKNGRKEHSVIASLFVWLSSKIDGSAPLEGDDDE
jgi:hypothetical protein